MQRHLLFCIALACAAIIVYPVVAQNESVAPDATGEAETVNVRDIGTDMAENAASGLESAIQDVAAKANSSAVDSFAESAVTFLRTDVFGFTLGQLFLSFSILLFGLMFRNILSHLVIRRLVKLAEEHARVDTRFVLALTKPISALILIGAIYLALLVLPLDPGMRTFISNAFRGLSMLAVVWGALMLNDVFAEFVELRFCSQSSSALVGFAPLISRVSALVHGRNRPSARAYRSLEI